MNINKQSIDDISQECNYLGHQYEDSKNKNSTLRSELKRIEKISHIGFLMGGPYRIYIIFILICQL